MRSATFYAGYYGLRADASESFIQGYLTEFRRDRKLSSFSSGKKIPGKKCGGTYISAGYNCRKEKTGAGSESAKELAARSRAAKGLKPKESRQQKLKLASLAGSEKQVKWAQDIRDKKRGAIQSIFDRNRGLAADPQKAMQAILDESDSKFWIDNRDTPAWALAVYGTRKTEQNQWTIDKGAPYKAEMITKTNGVITSRETIDYQVSATRFLKPLTLKAAQKIQAVESDAGNLRFSSKDDIQENEHGTPLIRALPPGSMANSDIKFIAGRLRSRGIELAPVFRSTI